MSLEARASYGVSTPYAIELTNAVMAPRARNTHTNRRSSQPGARDLSIRITPIWIGTVMAAAMAIARNPALQSMPGILA